MPAMCDLLRFAIVRPATENTRSDCADVAGIHKIRRASSASNLYFFLKTTIPKDRIVFLPKQGDAGFLLEQS